MRVSRFVGHTGKMLYFCIRFQTIKIMFFAFGDSHKKDAAAKSTLAGGGASQYMVGNQVSNNHSSADSASATRRIFRVGSHSKSGAASRSRRMKEIKQGDLVVLEFGCSNCSFDWKAVAENPAETHAPLLSAADFRTLYCEVIGQVRALGAKPVLLTLPVLLPQRFFDYVSRGLNKQAILQWLGGDVNKLSEWYDQYNQELLRLSREMEVPVIDISTIFVDRRSLGDCYGPDGMRPNKRGNAMIAEAVMASGL